MEKADDGRRATPMDLTVREFAIVLTVVFGMGMLVAWALFGQPRAIEHVVGSGSIAEWVAALGTWVIGIGAWRYARDSFLHNARKDKSAKIAHLELMSAKAKRIASLSKMFRKYDVAPEEVRSSGFLAELLRTHGTLVDSIQWTNEERACLNERCHQLLNSIEFDSIRIRELSKTALRVLADEAAVKSGEAQEAIDYVRECAQDAELACDSLITEMRGIRALM